MKAIKITRGEYALVDDIDYEKIAAHKWFCKPMGNNKYAAREVDKKIIYMHRIILGAKAGQICDHINGNSLDNRRANLRFCTRGQNAKNRGVNKNNTTGIKGVTWYKRLKKWRAQIRVDYKLEHIGLFDNKNDAEIAYKQAAKKAFGEYARI